MKLKFNVQNILLVLIFVMLISIRFVFIDSVPPGMAHDEVIYSLTSKSLITKGIDLTGFGLPLAFFKTYTEGNISVLPPFLLSPFFAIIPLNQLTIRILYVSLSILTSFALFLFVYYLFKNKRLAIISTIFFLISPWAFFLSRFTTESPFALFFFLLGMATLLKFHDKKLIIPFLFFALGFFSYHGAKTIYPFVIPAVLLYLLSNKTKNKLSKKSAITFFFAAISILILFILISQFIPGSILSQRKDLFFLDTVKITKMVDENRSLTINNSALPVFTNKASAVISIFAQQYLTAFSPDVLFLHGDLRIVYSFFVHGLFYYFDFFFIFIGFIFIWLKQKREAALLTALLLIAPLPSAISGVEFSYIHRSFLMLPVLLSFSAAGFYAIWEYLKDKKYSIVILAGIVVIIVFSAADFYNFYFFRYPLQAGEYYSLNQKLEAKFIKDSLNGSRPIVSVSREPGNTFFESVFYSGSDNIFSQMQKNIPDFNKGFYHYSNVTFIGECPEFKNDAIYVVDYDMFCFPDNNASYIIRNPKDLGPFYKIYNSSLCKGVKLNAISQRLTSDYKIEKMDKNTFCNRWISE